MSMGSYTGIFGDSQTANKLAFPLTAHFWIWVMLYDVIVSIFRSVGLIVECLMGRKQP